MAMRDIWKGLFRKAETSAPKPRGTEVGYTGTRIFSGLPMEEYNPDLAFPASIKVYDQMRRSDGQIAAMLAATTLPIRSTKWYVDPDENAQNEAQAKQIAEFVSDNMFGGMKYSWDDHLREALLMLVFGFSIFEKVYRYDTWNGRPVIFLDKYAPRVASSIWRFPQDDKFDVAAVEQINYMTGQIMSIPLERCRVYTYQREGSNIVGISMLRPAYKHWYIKDSLYKIVAVGIEKSLVGTPYAKVPKGTSEEEKQRILAVLTAVRAAEEAGFTLPADVEPGVLEGHRNPVDALPFIEHQDTLIARSILAQFINLGTMASASGGSYALGNTMVDMFVMGCEAVANYIQGEVQKDIEELVSWNFGPDAPVPQLKHRDISFKDMAQVATALGALGSGHLLVPDEELENHIREMFGVPPIPENALRNQTVLPPNRYVPDVVPDNAMPIPKQQDLQTAKVLQQMRGGGQKQASMSDQHGVQFADNVLPTATNGEKSYPKGTTKWRRDLTPREQVVRFAELNDQWTTAEDQFVMALQEVLRKAGTQYIAQIEKILANASTTTAQKISAISALQMPLVATYTDTIQQEIKAAYQVGRQSVAEEVVQQSGQAGTQAAASGAKGSIIPQADTAVMAAKASTLASLQLQKLTSGIQLSAVSLVQREVPPKKIVFDLKKVADAYITGPDLKTAGMITIAESINIGRGSEARQHDVQGAEYSAVLDDHTCPLCSALDGKVISVDNPDFDLFRPPLHNGCRCILVYILNEEENVEYTWTTPPYELVKHYGHLVNA